MNLKIVNKKKFVRSIILIFLLVIIISFIVNNKTYSHAETKYKTTIVSSGDTLWSIAKEEKQLNSYYANKDIRYIVSSIRTTNHLSNSDLKVSQELLIPML